MRSRTRLSEGQLESFKTSICHILALKENRLHCIPMIKVRGRVQVIYFNSR